MTCIVPQNDVFRPAQWFLDPQKDDFEKFKPKMLCSDEKNGTLVDSQNDVFRPAK